MKLARFILIGAAVLAVIATLTLVVALNSSFQTWMVQRELASRPELALTVGRVDAGFGGVELRDVRYATAGARVYAPLVKARMPMVPAVWNSRLDISRLEANGWTVEVLRDPEPQRASPAIETGTSTPNPLVPAARATAEQPPTPATMPMPPPAENGFRGIFSELDLPFDLRIDTMELNGSIAVQHSRARGKVSVAGGGIGVGRDAKIDVRMETAVEQGAVSTIHLEGQITARMDTPRTFRKAGASVRATAAGPRLASHVTLRAELGAVRDERAESYTAEVNGDARRLFSFVGEFPLATRRITGTWKLDVRDADIATFTLGRQIPSFAAAGEGRLDADASFETVHTIGKFDADVDRLGLLRPELAAIGRARVTAGVDVARRGSSLHVAVLDVAFATDRPVASLRSLQAFEFNTATAELRPTDPQRELVGIQLHGVPLAWVKPFAPEYSLTGGDVRGELVATPRSGGINFKATRPITVQAFSLGQRGNALLQGLDLSLTASGDYTPQGWQVDIGAVTAKTGARTMLMLDARAGQLARAGEPIKATGLVTIDLAAVAAQPIAQGAIALGRGEASVEFAANLAATMQFDAKVSVKNLFPAGEGASPLPTVAATLRADVAANGGITFNAPVAFRQGERESDLSLVGTLSAVPAKRTFTAQVTSKNLVLDDVRPFAALAPQTSKPAPREEQAPWTGLEGTLNLQLGHVIYSEKLEMKNVLGTVRFSQGTMKLENVRTAVGETGDALINAVVNYSPRVRPPYSANAHVTLADFDPAPLFVTVNPRQLPTIEGKFTLAAQTASRATTLGGLLKGQSGRFEMTSRGGTFRGLTVNVGNLVENSSKLAGWLASAGSAITSIAGRKDPEADAEEIKSRSQAASELAKALSSIAYDQLNMVVERDESRNTTVKEFTLISPELRITGTGVAKYVPGRSIVDDTLAMELRLRARGRPAELMKFLGVLEPNPDNLGYAACTIPVTVSGTFANVDTTELSNRLVALAVEKAGLTDKAVDWIGKLRGK